MTAFACNQRDEVRDLHDVAGALCASQSVKQQTFVTAPIMVPSVICLNDQGGQRMDVHDDMTGTLRARMDGHPPLVLVAQDELDDKTYCISGNIIGREDENGGNGCGFQPNISYTLTATDKHAVLANGKRVTGTLMANCATKMWLGNQEAFSGDSSILQNKLIRRLVPLECEKLMGYPDYWTDIPGASDSARYKALGNSVAIPCVEFVLRGIAYFLLKNGDESGYAK